VIKGKKVLAIIPARGGSKGLSGKNLVNFMWTSIGRLAYTGRFKFEIY